MNDKREMPGIELPHQAPEEVYQGFMSFQGLREGKMEYLGILMANTTAPSKPEDT